MKKYLNNILKAGALAALLGAAYFCGKKDPNNSSPAPSLFNFGKTEVADYVIRLPDGTNRIEYEKLVGSPWQDFTKYGDLDPRASINEKDVVLWAPKGNFTNRSNPAGAIFGSRWEMDLFHGQFFQKVNNQQKIVEQTNILNPSDGIPGALIVPKFKKIVKGNWIDEGFFAYIFVDQDYMDQIKNPKLYSGGYSPLRFVRNLNFKKEKDIFFEKIDSLDFIKDKNYKVLPDLFVIADFNNKKEHIHPMIFENVLYTVFGIYKRGMKDSSVLKSFQEDKESFNKKSNNLEKLLNKCFNGNTHNQLNNYYHLSKMENPQSSFFEMSVPDDTAHCSYTSPHGSRRLSLNYDVTSMVISLREDNEKIFKIKMKLSKDHLNNWTNLSSDEVN
ncbi:MAG: hypothetical protein KKE23_02850 [Nanoarchaeota archaeon]|nr:hypothetical protein [Nanoarchaeota archaeon]